MLRDAHKLMQDVHHLGRVPPRPINDDMGVCKVEPGSYLAVLGSGVQIGDFDLAAGGHRYLSR
jgi:hypothetical protein